jgi:hypothetical protein
VKSKKTVMTVDIDRVVEGSHEERSRSFVGFWRWNFQAKFLEQVIVTAIADWRMKDR